MSESQRFAVAAHVLVYLASRDADRADRQISSRVLAQTLPTNAVVVRRATALLGKAGMIAARAGAQGGAWLVQAPSAITLDAVLQALDGGLRLGRAGPAVGKDAVMRQLPAAINAALDAADQAAKAQLASVTIQDLLERAKAAVSTSTQQTLEGVHP